MKSLVINENIEGAHYTEVVNLDTIRKCRYYPPYKNQESRLVVYFIGVTDVIKHNSPWGFSGKSPDELEFGTHEVFWGDIADKLWEQIANGM
jgi:hypothetical protein